jgi:hypothetical protein
MRASVYERVVRITHIYLGPAADRFIDRQVENHLGKMPKALTLADLSQLIDWIRVAVSLMTDDAEIVDEYIEQLERLSRPPSQDRQHNGTRS